MSTPLPTPDQMNPNSRKSKDQEMEKLQQQFDAATGRAPSKPQTWHDESKLSKATRDLLDQQEPKQQKSGGFYREPEAMKSRQEAFDAAVKHIQDPPTYKLGPVSAEEKLRSWHKSLGTPANIVEKEVADLKKQEARK